VAAWIAAVRLALSSSVALGNLKVAITLSKAAASLPMKAWNLPRIGSSAPLRSAISPATAS